MVVESAFPNILKLFRIIIKVWGYEKRNKVGIGVL